MNPFKFVLTLTAFAALSYGANIPDAPNLREGQFSPLQRRILKVLGDRLQKPGKESLVLNGILDDFTNGQKTSSNQVSVVWQYPGLMRVDYAGINQSLIFNGNQVVRQGGTAAQHDKDLAESIMKDSAENFLLGRFSGSTVQLIGEQYNIKDSRSTNRLAGQCDLLNVTETNGIRGQGSKVEKMYCFDPVTSLLKAVIYRDSGAVVETRYSGWHDVSGQAVPAAIQRWNNSSQVFALTVLQASLSGKQTVGFFDVP